jgi:hypothetical protein
VAVALVLGTGDCFAGELAVLSPGVFLIRRYVPTPWKQHFQEKLTL